ncbi:tuliposide A-converting enzyme b1, amyloplastic-like [Oryza brachyantha]|uniref:tuliposide A-converting enzyme b1, amyloplastic-like n=1 Tax=Oryza brachyantha TaxID=4533 RepID=UPI001AD97CAA|nr:tuliposide A-converting enzyme b1, amyloplastic-like [Oryza brachyantha]
MQNITQREVCINATPQPMRLLPPSIVAMEPHMEEVVFDSSFFRIYKNGNVHRLYRPPIVAAGVDDATGVVSKDVVLDTGTGLFVRVYLPKGQEPGKKLPLLVYFHGGGFIIESADSATYHNYLNAVAAVAGVLVVSVNYRLAPENPLPAGYEDSWAALLWAVSRKDDWLAEHGDTARVFVAGDSAGGNIVHNMLLRASSSDGPTIEGAILLHPFFGGSTAIDGESEEAVHITSKVWTCACPGAANGVDDPRMNPTAPGAPALESVGCARLLVCAAQEDWLAARGRAYYAAVAASAWRGSAAWHETEGEGHVFFLRAPGNCDKARQLMDRVVAFISGA